MVVAEFENKANMVKSSVFTSNESGVSDFKKAWDNYIQFMSINTCKNITLRRLFHSNIYYQLPNDYVPELSMLKVQSHLRSVITRRPKHKRLNLSGYDVGAIRGTLSRDEIYD